ncbi:MAG: hypothetical protein WCK77_20970, partial [Verrucomicrobiota bacterium]
FTRRTFMKTTALTIGAVALLSQGRALADGDSGGSSTLSISFGIGEGVKRTLPFSDFLSFSDRWSAFDAAIKIESPLADATCILFDRITYSCTIRLWVKDSLDQFYPNSTITYDRYFIAWTDSHDLVRSAELLNGSDYSLQGQSTLTDWYSDPATIEGIDYYIGIQTKTTAVGANTVAVKARGLVKRASTGEVTELNWSPERVTVWQICNRS